MRLARHGLVLAVATLLTVAYGTRHEDARARNRLWARVWLTPMSGLHRVADLHCLSGPVTRSGLL